MLRRVDIIQAEAAVLVVSQHVCLWCVNIHVLDCLQRAMGSSEPSQSCMLAAGSATGVICLASKLALAIAMLQARSRACEERYKKVSQVCDHRLPCLAIAMIQKACCNLFQLPSVSVPPSKQAVS